jgi:hypothetical protein
MSLIRQTAWASAQFSGCSSTTNAHSETGQMTVCCQNLTRGVLSRRSVLYVLVGALFKKFSLFLNTPCIISHSVALPHNTTQQHTAHTTHYIMFLLRNTPNQNLTQFPVSSIRMKLLYWNYPTAQVAVPWQPQQPHSLYMNCGRWSYEKRNQSIERSH